MREILNLLKWRMHQRRHGCTVKGAAWGSGNVAWSCSCRRGFTVTLWDRGQP